MEVGIIIYTLLAILVFTLLLSSKNKENKKRNIPIIISFLLIFTVAAIRVGVGTDYYGYEEWFYKTNSINSFMDSGFNLLVLIIKIFSNNSQWLFVLSSFIILIFIFKSAMNEQDNYDLSILLFITLSFFFSSNNTIRQWISTAILMYSVKYIKSKKILIFMLLVAVASTFHMLSLIFIPFYWILNMKIKNRTRIIFLCGFVVIGTFLLNGDKIFDLIKTVFPFYYDRYIATDSSLLYKGGGSMFPVLLSGGMLIYYLVFEKKLREVIDYDYKINLSVVLVIASLFNTYNSLYARMAAFIMPMIIFLIPDILAIFDGKSKKKVYLLIVIVSMVFMLYTLYFKNSYDALPYNTIFNNYL